MIVDCIHLVRHEKGKIICVGAGGEFPCDNCEHYMADEPAFVKADQAKPRMSLIPPFCLEAAMAVLEAGAKKYSDNNWMKGEQTRYYDALMRHMLAYQGGESKDPETGYNHTWHALCCMLFIVWLEKRDDDRDVPRIGECERETK